MRFVGRHFWRVLAKYWFVYVGLIAASVALTLWRKDETQSTMSFGLVFALVVAAQFARRELHVTIRDILNILILALTQSIVIGIPLIIALRSGNSFVAVTTGFVVAAPTIILLMAFPNYMLASPSERSVVRAWKSAAGTPFSALAASALTIGSLFCVWWLAYKVTYPPLSAWLLAYYTAHQSMGSYRLIVGTASGFFYATQAILFAAMGSGLVAIAAEKAPTASG